MISVGLGLAVVVDTVLAAVLIYVLHTSRTGLQKSVVCSVVLRACGMDTDLRTLHQDKLDAGHFDCVCCVYRYVPPRDRLVGLFSPSILGLLTE